MASLESLCQCDVSRETRDKLSGFQNLVQKWSKRINLVSPSTLDDVWDRHILDSAQLWPLIPGGVEIYADLGSGGGFPGIVLAILFSEHRVMETHLIESDARKSVFLRQAARELGVNVTVHTGRIEEITPLNADFLTARALAPLNTLAGYAKRHLKPDGVAIFPKGRRVDEEMEDAPDLAHFRMDQIESRTDPLARIIRLKGH